LLEIKVFPRPCPSSHIFSIEIPVHTGTELLLRGQKLLIVPLPIEMSGPPRFCEQVGVVEVHARMVVTPAVELELLAPPPSPTILVPVGRVQPVFSKMVAAGSRIVAAVLIVVE
jgi:hypothetical protein